MNIYYRVKTIEHFIPIDPPDGGMDSVTYAIVAEVEAETIPQNDAYTLKSVDYRVTETFFDSYEKAQNFADSVEPGYPHKITRRIPA